MLNYETRKTFMYANKTIFTHKYYRAYLNRFFPIFETRTFIYANKAILHTSIIDHI